MSNRQPRLVVLISILLIVGSSCGDDTAGNRSTSITQRSPMSIVATTVTTAPSLFLTPSVWEWKGATFTTTSGSTPQTETVLIRDGMSRLCRLVDYTTSTSQVCTGEDCRCPVIAQPAVPFPC